MLKGLNAVKGDILGFFDKYIWYFVAIAVAIVGGYAGFKYYEYHEVKHYTDVVKNAV